MNSSVTGGAPFLMGDANLDGVVDGQDFVTWNSAKFTLNTAWCAGNFNGDGVVDGQDFVIWNNHKFSSSMPQTAPVVPQVPAHDSGGRLVRKTDHAFRRRGAVEYLDPKAVGTWQYAARVVALDGDADLNDSGMSAATRDVINRQRIAAAVDTVMVESWRSAHAQILPFRGTVIEPGARREGSTELSRSLGELAFPQSRPDRLPSVSAASTAVAVQTSPAKNHIARRPVEPQQITAPRQSAWDETDQGLKAAFALLTRLR
jgi:hypothetical protein